MIGVVVALIGMLYATVLRDLALDWWSQESISYGLLIPPLALYVAWIRRGLTLAKPAVPDFRGLWVVGACCFLYLLGRL